MSAVRLITLDPGHFHAALVQKEMYPGVAPRPRLRTARPRPARAPGRIAGFNIRPENPTQWDLEIHAGPDFLQRMLREKPGNVVVLSGRNRARSTTSDAARRGRPARAGRQAVDHRRGRTCRSSKPCSNAAEQRAWSPTTS